MFRPTAFAVAAALFGAMILNITLQPILASVFLDGRAPERQAQPRLRVPDLDYTGSAPGKALRTKEADHRRLRRSDRRRGRRPTLSWARSSSRLWTRGRSWPRRSCCRRRPSRSRSRWARGSRRYLLSFPEVVSVSRTTGHGRGLGAPPSRQPQPLQHRAPAAGKEETRLQGDHRRRCARSSTSSRASPTSSSSRSPTSWPRC